MKNIAIITGASSGIGKEFVKEINITKPDEIWVIANDKKGLEELKKEITTPLKIFDLDLTKDESLKEIEKTLNKEKPNVKWLINCAGTGAFGKTDEIPIKTTSNIIDLNCKAAVYLTEIVLPYMQAYGKIIQMSSVFAFNPYPYMSTFAASKTFILNYSRALRQELKNRKIYVTCVCPYWVKTDFLNKAKVTKQDVITNYTTMIEPSAVAQKAIKTAIRRKELCIIGKKTKWLHFISKILPAKFIMWIWKRQQGFKKKYPKNK